MQATAADVMLAIEYAPESTKVRRACTTHSIPPPPVGWLCSEKIDGMRGLWNGTEMRSREGHTIGLPSEFRGALPSIPLDGELVCRSGGREATGLFRRKTPNPDQWKESGVLYMVFDSPGSEPYEKRLKSAKKEVCACKGPKWVTFLAQVPVREPGDLDAFFQHVADKGGEGVVLRAPKSPYVSGYTPLLLKKKVVDVERMTVVKVLSGKGRREGKIGSIKVRFERTGELVNVGVLTGDVAWKNGNVALVRFRGVSAQGRPLHATLAQQTPVK
jgi:DNA ligase 1